MAMNKAPDSLTDEAAHVQKTMALAAKNRMLPTSRFRRLVRWPIHKYTLAATPTRKAMAMST